MYIVVQHEISNPESFWSAAQAGMADLPPTLKVHQVLPNQEGTKASCLWEADQIEQVRDFLEPEVGASSKNTYFAVEDEKAIGLFSRIQ